MNRKENICLCAGEKSQKKQVSDLLLFQWAFCDEIIFRSVKNAIDVCLVWKKKFNLAWSALGNVRCETSVLLELFLSVELNETLLMIKINKMHFFNSLEGFLTNLLFGVQKVIYTLSQIFLNSIAAKYSDFFGVTPIFRANSDNPIFLRKLRFFKFWKIFFPQLLLTCIVHIAVQTFFF